MSRRITMTDCRRAGFCASGIFRWFKTHGMDIRILVRGELDIEDLRAMNDGMANRVIKHVEESDGR